MTRRSLVRGRARGLDVEGGPASGSTRSHQRAVPDFGTAFGYHRADMFGPVFHVARRHCRAIALIALVALTLGQAMAVAHASRHVGPDAAGLPGNHAQLCTDCASIAPLLAVAGGTTSPLFVGARCGDAFVLPAIQAPAATVLHLAFRSRAPPR